MIVYPAIDLRGGRCVRLVQGDVAAETVFADDPVDAARRWVAEGAEWLHVVNLDGALPSSDRGDSKVSASAENLRALARMVSAVEVPIQFGGGVRGIEDVGRLLDAGVARVILGTVAVRQPHVVAEAVARYGADRVSVGVDARDGWVVIHGWTDTAGVSAMDLARQMAALGVTRIVYTDVGRDGTLRGVNVEATAALARMAGVGVIASGGLASLDDVRALKVRETDGIEGVIIGMALYRGIVSLTNALSIARGG